MSDKKIVTWVLGLVLAFLGIIMFVGFLAGNDNKRLQDEFAAQCSQLGGVVREVDRDTTLCVDAEGKVLWVK